MGSRTLFICTVGGSPQPVLAALKYRRPSRVCFVHMPQSRVDIEKSALPGAKNGAGKLGLEDAYRLLDSFGDPLGETFWSHGLDGETSPLVVRNRSILAHGFERVSGKVFDQLWGKALELDGIEESSLTSFHFTET